jgi:hypothetical protein
VIKESAVSSFLAARRSLFLLFPMLLAQTVRAAAWGFAGHHYINGLAIDCLPVELRPLYAANRDWIVQHSVDPDLWREQNRTEGPHHFIDLDTWGLEVAANFPQDYWTACGLYGEAAIDRNGVVPWRIGQYYGKLVRAFKERDARRIVEVSAWLGHYAADIHVPFHACANYDGQLTGQKGVHARFESDLLDRQIKPTDLKPHPAQRIKDPVAAAFCWARASLQLSEIVLRADRSAASQDAAYGDAYFAAFGKDARPIAVRRLEDGARDLASLWYSAWLAAGRPELPTPTDTHAGEPPDRSTHDPDLPVQPSGEAQP